MMQEVTVPGNIIVHKNETLYNVLTERLENNGPESIIAEYKSGENTWDRITAGEYHERVLQCAKGLIALGINKGDSVAIFSSTRIEWGIMDFALASIGAVNVPIYDTDSASQAEQIIVDSQVKLAFADNKERYNRLNSFIDKHDNFERILMFDSNALGALEGLGVAVADDELEKRINSVQADDLATIVYTSGSTGTPKGVELTHRNFLWIVRAGYYLVPEVVYEDSPRLLLFLPLAHCFARYVHYCSIGSDNGVVGYLPSTKTLLKDLRTFEPTYLLGVPRVFEKVYNAASQKAGFGVKGKIFHKAAVSARRWSRMIERGQKPSTQEVAEHMLYETAVYRNIRGALGSRIRFVACGGAPLDTELAHFFAGIGLKMIQGYGLTETAAPFTVTPVDETLIGTVGGGAPGSSIRIADDGEVQLKGDNIFRAYHNMTKATKEAFTQDGWLKTGDLGYLDDEGRLFINGRKKDIIITAGGKNVSPIPLEQEIMNCPLVEHAVVLGDNKPFVSALITLDEEGLRGWLRSQHINTEISLQDAARNEDIREEIQKYVDKANSHVSRAESIRKFAISPSHFTQDNACLTPSMKIVRPKINTVFADFIAKNIYTRG
ncbi:MAG: AMP-binding protein [Bifidobacteriaceae bacterium]|nr:AMP-binding protein [Bifidobacteriaceae bacterium]